MSRRRTRSLGAALIAAVLSIGLVGGCIIRDDGGGGDHHQGYAQKNSSYQQGRQDQRYHDRHGWWNRN